MRTSPTCIIAWTLGEPKLGCASGVAAELVRLMGIFAGFIQPWVEGRGTVMDTIGWVIGPYQQNSPSGRPACAVAIVDHPSSCPTRTLNTVIDTINGN
jgi:hypothetical protein